MNELAILLIDNQISVAAEIVRVVGEHLPGYRLSIVKGIAEAVAEPEPVDVILLNACMLDDVSYSKIIRHLLPFFAAMIVVLLLTTYIPWLSMALPAHVFTVF